MLLAEKANRRVRIADEKKDEYIGMGYTIKNLDGTLLKAPDDPKKQVKKLEAEIAALKAEKVELEDSLKKATEDANAASDARMELLNSTREENEQLKVEIEALQKENDDLKAKLEAQAGSETPKKETKGKQTDK